MSLKGKYLFWRIDTVEEKRSDPRSGSHQERSTIWFSWKFSQG